MYSRYKRTKGHIITCKVLIFEIKDIKKPISRFYRKIPAVVVMILKEGLEGKNFFQSIDHFFYFIRKIHKIFLNKNITRKLQVEIEYFRQVSYGSERG